MRPVNVSLSPVGASGKYPPLPVPGPTYWPLAPPTPHLSSEAMIVTVTMAPFSLRTTSGLSIATDCSTGGVLSHAVPEMLTLTAATSGLSVRKVARLFASSCSVTCSSCQSPQSMHVGTDNSHCHTSSCPCRQPAPMRASPDGLLKTALTRWTPDLSSLACTKMMSFSPP